MLIEQHSFLVCSQQEKNRDKVTTKIKDKYFRPSYDSCTGVSLFPEI